MRVDQNLIQQKILPFCWFSALKANTSFTTRQTQAPCPILISTDKTHTFASKFYCLQPFQLPSGGSISKITSVTGPLQFQAFANKLTFHGDSQFNISRRLQRPSRHGCNSLFAHLAHCVLSLNGLCSTCFLSNKIST